MDVPQQNEPAPDGPGRSVTDWNAGWVSTVLPLLRAVGKLWFRSEVTGMEKVPDGGVLLVSNHSGGLLAYDVPLIAVAFADEFGPQRPLCTLAHDLITTTPLATVFKKYGFLRAHPKEAVAALEEGQATLVFPGGDWEVMRPVWESATIDFGGNKGYVRTAVEAGVPIVPIVSIGGQETQLFFTDGRRLARLTRLDKLFRFTRVPLGIGFPFGITPGMPPNIPAPAKIVTRVLDPIDITAEFGADPDLDAVDAHVRDRMQTALTELAEQRRFPIIG